MFSDRSLPFSWPPAVLAMGDIVRFPKPKVGYPNDDGSSRMSDEGCPNESSSVDDATGYSREEEEVEATGKEVL